MRYFYTPSTGQVLGPVALEELRFLRQQARITDKTPVREEKTADWCAYADLAPVPTFSLTAPPPSSPQLGPESAFTRRWEALRRSPRFNGPVLIVAAFVLVMAGRMWVSKADDGPDHAPAAASGAAGQLPDTWRFVAYQGKHVPYRVFLHSFWTELPRPLDENADRTFVGPHGLVLSFYRFENLNSLQEGLKKTVPVTKIEQRRASDVDELVIDNAPVNGVRIVDAYIILFGGTPVALTMRAPQDVPWEIVEAFQYDVGVATAYSRKAYGHPDRPIDFVMHSCTESALLTRLGKWDDIERTSGAVLTTPGTVSKDAYKARLSYYFRWSVGNKLDVDAASFQRVMGRPTQTQTVQIGSDVTTRWYYECADGTIQLVTDARLLANGKRLQATVNDY